MPREGQKTLTTSEAAAAAVESRKVAGLDAFDTSGPASGADWGACSSEWIQAVVEKITAMEGAVIFGTSRDGGAYLVTLLLNKDKKTIWIGGGEDLELKLEEICATLDSMT